MKRSFSSLQSERVTTQSMASPSTRAGSCSGSPALGIEGTCASRVNLTTLLSMTLSGALADRIVSRGIRRLISTSIGTPYLIAAGRSGRQLKPGAQAAGRRAAERDRSAIELRQVADDGEAQAGAWRRFVCPHAAQQHGFP